MGAYEIGRIIDSTEGTSVGGSVATRHKGNQYSCTYKYI